MLDKTPEKIIDISTSSIVRVLLIIAFAYSLYLLIDVWLVVFLAIIIASSIEPATQWFLRRGVPRILSVLLIYSIVAIFLVAVFYFIFIPLLSQVSSLISSLPEYTKELQVWNPLKSNSFLSSNPTVQGLSSNFSLVQVADQINTIANNIQAGFFSALSAVFGGALSFILVIVLSFYFSVEANGIASFLRIVTPVNKEKYVLDLWKRSQSKIGLWMQGQIVLAIIIAVLVFLGLTLMGIENALLLAIIAGLFEIIPLFGPILAAIPAVSIALITDGMASAVLVIGLYIIIQQFENQLIYPLVVRKIVGVPPVISILALLIGAKLAGFIGMLISVPVASILMELMSDIEKKKLSSQEYLQSTSEK